jgi:hypothetical protein
MDEGRGGRRHSIGDVVKAVISTQASMIEHLEGDISPR